MKTLRRALLTALTVQLTVIRGGPVSKQTLSESDLFLKQLTEMGIERTHAIMALAATDNASVLAALDWYVLIFVIVIVFFFFLFFFFLFFFFFFFFFFFLFFFFFFLGFLLLVHSFFLVS